MARRTKHKNGMTVYWADNFFVVDAARLDEDQPDLILPDGVSSPRDGYKAIVAFDNYHFDQINTANVSLLTPAQQLVWNRQVIEYDVSPYILRYYVLTEFAETWLTANIGKRYVDWDVRTRAHHIEKDIFFRKRSDALKLINYVNKVLKGIRHI